MTRIRAETALTAARASGSNRFAHGRFFENRAVVVGRNVGDRRALEPAGFDGFDGLLRRKPQLGLRSAGLAQHGGFFPRQLMPIDDRETSTGFQRLADDARQAFAVGQSGTILRFNGSRWLGQTSGAPNTSQ